MDAVVLRALDEALPPSGPPLPEDVLATEALDQANEGEQERKRQRNSVRVQEDILYTS